MLNFKYEQYSEEQRKAIVDILWYLVTKGDRGARELEEITSGDVSAYDMLLVVIKYYIATIEEEPRC